MPDGVSGRLGPENWGVPAVHELSLAQAIVEQVSDTARTGGYGAVTAVNLRVGAMAGVVRESLEFCWDLAVDGSAIAGSVLQIEELPVIVHCLECEDDVVLDEPVPLLCPRCGNFAPDVRQGRELEIASFEVDEELPA